MARTIAQHAQINYNIIGKIANKLTICPDCLLVSNFAEDVVVDPCMLCYCSCHVQLAFCVLLMGVCLDCHDLLRSECIELVNMPT